jgi:hypothetical protein
MSAGEVAAAIGIGLAAAALVGLVVFLVWLVRSSRRVAEEVRSSYDDAVLGPERGTYRGGTVSYSRVANSCWLVLTPDRLVVRSLIGKGFTVPIASVTGTRIEKSYKGRRSQWPVLVLETTKGEVGLSLTDLAKWQAALTTDRT